MFVRHFKIQKLPKKPHTNNAHKLQMLKSKFNYLKLLQKSCIKLGRTYTGSRSIFEFPSRVNLSGPSLYCIPGRWLNKAGLAGAARLTRADFRLNLLLLKGQSVRGACV